MQNFVLIDFVNFSLLHAQPTGFNGRDIDWNGKQKLQLCSRTLFRIATNPIVDLTYRITRLSVFTEFGTRYCHLE